MEVHTAMNNGRRPSVLLLIARGVWLEVGRREQHLALFILMGLYLVIAIGARLAGNTQEEAVSLMLNMGLWLSASLSAVLTLLTGANVLTSEFETRTIYPLLAKSVERKEVLLGKALATVVCGWVILSLFTILTVGTWTATFPLPGQDLVMFFQAFVLQMVAIGVLAAVAILFSLVFPKSVAVLVAGILFFAGSPILGLIRAVFRETPLSGIIGWVLGYIPDFSKLCLFQRFTDGAPHLYWMAWFGLLVYGVVLTLFFLGVASILFERRSL